MKTVKDGMKITRYTDPAAFWARVAPLYRADPLRHTIALTVLDALVNTPDPDAEPPLLVTFDRGETVEGAAFCTPPRPMGVSAVPDDLMPELVEFLREQDFPVTGVSSPVEKADLFADRWLAVAGGTKHQVFALRLYRLADLLPPEVPGAARLADESDIPLLAPWRAAFVEDTSHDERHEDHAGIVRRSLANGAAHLIWHVDGVPVAHAVASRPVAGMSRISLVYTPPEHRGHGYGSAVTAATAQCALDAGAEHVSLFTDLANPTSNSIYQKIGFVPHHDAIEYRFV